MTNCFEYALQIMYITFKPLKHVLNNHIKKMDPSNIKFSLGKPMTEEEFNAYKQTNKGLQPTVMNILPPGRSESLALKSLSDLGPKETPTETPTPQPPLNPTQQRLRNKLEEKRNNQT